MASESELAPSPSLLNRAMGKATEVITLGGSSAIMKSWGDYESAKVECSRTADIYSKARSALDTETAELGREVEQCLLMLRAAKDYVERLTFNKLRPEVSGPGTYSPPNLKQATDVLREFDLIAVTGKGAAAGSATSLGAWFLVVHLGSASTGAAISGLTGAAATNAALAWFGGGALWAGGGGMLVGGFVLSGLLVLPFLGWSAHKSYGEAKRIDEATRETLKAAKHNLENAHSMTLLAGKSGALKEEYRAYKEIFNVECYRVQAEARKLAEHLSVGINMFAALLKGTNDS